MRRTSRRVGRRDATHAVVLAGGRGTRLQRITRGLGEPAEKQFCRLGGERTLLQGTVDRLRGLVDGATVVVRRDHLYLATAQLADMARVAIVAQPDDHGTGIGVLAGLVSAYRAASGGVVVLVPADHGFTRPEVLQSSLRDAVAIARRSRRIVLVGAEADAPRTDYGWIVAEGAGSAQTVRVFVEKPGLDEARQLHAAGALFNTMMMAAPTQALLGLFARGHASTLKRLMPAAKMGPWQRDRYLSACFARLPTIDFSREVVAQAPDLLVTRLPTAAGWTDLGDERRVIAWLETQGPRAVLQRVRALCEPHVLEQRSEQTETRV